MDNETPQFRLKKLGSEDKTEPVESPQEDSPTFEQPQALTDPQAAPTINQSPRPEKKSPLRLKYQESAHVQNTEDNPSVELPQKPACPQCKRPMTSLSATICTHCGYTKKRENVEEEEHPSWIQAATISKEALICLIIGLTMTLILTSGNFQFLYFILHHFNILVHEFGHCAWSWMMGFQAFPAFDFQHGGGMTMTFGRKPSWLIAGFIIFCIAGTAFKYRKYKMIVFGLLAICAFNIFAITNYKYGDVIVYGGHATEAIFGCVFIYRGLTNVSVHHVVERVLYFFLGTFLLLDQYFFSKGIMSDPVRRAQYIEGKPSTLNDMVKISHSHVITLDSALVFHLQFCLFSAVMTYVIYVLSMRFYTTVE